MDELERHHKQQAFEHELINRRLTWLLTSQTILFATLAFVMAKDSIITDHHEFLSIVSCLGIAISLMVWVGVVMGIFAKCYNWKDYRSNHDRKKHWGERTWITIIALVPDVIMPIAFVVAWGYIRGMMG